MGVATLAKELGLGKAWEGLQQAPTQEPPISLGASAANLVKSIRDGTVTIKQIDSFLQKARQITADQKEYLLRKKAWLLLRQNHGEEALQSYEEALKVNEESPLTWVAKGSALLELERLDEVFQSLQKAYSFRENFGDQKQGWLRFLFEWWSTIALFWGLFGILQRDSRQAQKGVYQYLDVLDKAKNEGLEAAVLNLAVEQPVSKKLEEALEELELMVRLLSIKDPFEGWQALAKEISKVWPQGVSAVDAIREQRDREWNK